MSALKQNSATENVSVSLPGWMIEILDAVCEEQDTSRSNYIKRAVKRSFLLDQVNDLNFYERLLHDVQHKSC